jgi:hypothetical protein
MCHPLESLVVMAAAQEKIDCLMWLEELKTVTRVQHLPSYSSIKKWDRHLREIISAVNEKSPRRPRTSNKDERFRQTLLSLA